MIEICKCWLQDSFFIFSSPKSFYFRDLSIWGWHIGTLQLCDYLPWPSERSLGGSFYLSCTATRRCSWTMYAKSFLFHVRPKTETATSVTHYADTYFTGRRGRQTGGINPLSSFQAVWQCPALRYLSSAQTFSIYCTGWEIEIGRERGPDQNKLDRGGCNSPRIALQYLVWNNIA